MSSKYVVRTRALPVGGGVWSIFDERRAAEAVAIAVQEWVGTPWSRSVHAPMRGTDCARFAMGVAAKLAGRDVTMPSIDTLRASLDPDVSSVVLSQFAIAFRPDFVNMETVEPGDIVVELGEAGRLVHVSLVSEAPPSVYTVLQSVGTVRTVLEARYESTLINMRLRDRAKWWQNLHSTRSDFRGLPK